ncbi:protein kinase [Steroidobacter sp. S1-65]|uniref:Protein kinase n=1 Tax=Steroidobacter gossypii TaxID=2805490 RepID=A0ABS1X1B0_9GAMM|nr:serine/threonine-protein kinase [Steroidobacter gossypii]MBM0107001.1 protein kinase [Steroidobacter gossypii]
MALPAGPATRPLAAASASLPPRVLIVTDHTELARALEHHISIVWSDAECRIHAPLISGRLHSAFTAAGYDAVLLDGRSERGRGEEWLENFLYRPGFPPVVYLAPGDDPGLAARVVERGAIDCLVRERIDHRRLANAMRDAVQRRRQELALWRTSSQAEQLSRFGPVKILGHRFVRELAIGGTSMVYLAESERAAEMVVLKVLRDAPETGDRHTQFSRFLQEYELISKIRHPNVVRIFDLGIADDHAYIAMEYFQRGDLRGRIARGVEPPLALQYLAQMAAALQVVHQVGVLHRDLKPGNIMERSDGSLALIDFGLAKHNEVQVEITGTGEIFGTPYYMSPEQGHGKVLDERSDLYSLGVIFHEMLTGKKPFLAPTPMGVIYLHGNAPRPALPAPLKMYQTLLDKLIAIEPADRFASARELLAEVSRLEAMAA